MNIDDFLKNNDKEYINAYKIDRENMKIEIFIDKIQLDNNEDDFFEFIDKLGDFIGKDNILVFIKAKNSKIYMN